MALTEAIQGCLKPIFSASQHVGETRIGEIPRPVPAELLYHENYLLLVSGHGIGGNPP